ncbi:putative acetyltransferase YhhY [compost metagenome]
MSYVIRSASLEDAQQLSDVRLMIDGETENMDRERGEGFIDPAGFAHLIQSDSSAGRTLLLVAEAAGRIVGFSRCEGSCLNRLAHKIEFGVCVLKEYWGYAIGSNLLRESIRWADANGVKKIALSVLGTNDKAIRLYEKFGFEIEGVLKQDKLLSDGHYYNTVMMGRIRSSD